MPQTGYSESGETLEEAKINLQEAIELFFEHASKDEIKYRLTNDIFITNMQIAIG